MRNQADEIYEFGPFCLNVGERLLLRDGQPVPLRGKVFDTLCLLVAHRGHLMATGELMNAVWHDSIVEESNLAHNISVLRKTLGEKSSGQKYIETVPRQGYRFVADVRRLGSLGARGNLAPEAEAPEPCVLDRDRELEVLRAALDGVERGRRQIVLVTGEAGIGKTTLVETFVRSVQGARPLRVGHGQCLENRGSGEAYMPILEALGRICREASGKSLVAVLSRQAPTWLAQMPWVVPDADLSALEHRVLSTTKDRMLREMVEALEALTLEDPLILVLEDLHWSDHSTVDLLARLARRRDPARLLVVGTYRPADVRAAAHPLGDVARELVLRGLARELPLALLTAFAVSAYLSSRLPGADVSIELVGQTLQRTGGNPLFLVNVVDSWIAQGLVSEVDGAWRLPDDLQVLTGDAPETLRQLIEQQLEQLDADDLTTLRAASVAGVDWSAATVAAALEGDEELIEVRCATLAHQGQFLRPRGTAEWPDGTVATEFGFRHDLYQEVLYDRLPAGKRARLHQRIGARLETGYGSHAAEHAVELAWHFAEARDATRAVHYLRCAAERALGRSAHLEAVELLTSGISLVAQISDVDARVQTEMSLQMLLAPALIATRGWAASDVDRAYARARELARTGRTPSEVFRILFGQAVVHQIRGEVEVSQALLAEGLALQPESQDATILLESHMLLACSAYHQGDFSLALEHAKLGVGLYDPLQHVTLTAHYGENPCVACHSWASLALWFLGHPDLAVQRARLAREVAQAPGHLYSLASARITSAIVRQFRGEAERTRRRAEAAIAIATEQGYPYRVAVGTILRGWARGALGERDGITELEAGLSQCRAIGAELDYPYYLWLLADARRQVGDLAGARVAVDEALGLVDDVHGFFWEAELHRLKGLLIWDDGGGRLRDEAEASMRRALEIAHRKGSPSLELRAALTLLRLGGHGREPTEVHRRLAEVYAAFSEGFELPELQEARGVLERAHLLAPLT